MEAQYIRHSLNLYSSLDDKDKAEANTMTIYALLGRVDAGCLSALVLCSDTGNGPLVGAKE